MTSLSCTHQTDVTVTVFGANACGGGPNTTAIPNVIGLHIIISILDVLCMWLQIVNIIHYSSCDSGFENLM